MTVILLCRRKPSGQPLPVTRQHDGYLTYQSTRFFQGNRITLGFDWFRYGGHAWNEYVSGSQAGTTSELVDKHEDELAGYIDFRQDFNTWLTLNAGLRVDHHPA